MAEAYVFGRGCGVINGDISVVKDTYIVIPDLIGAKNALITYYLEPSTSQVIAPLIARGIISVSIKDGKVDCALAMADADYPTRVLQIAQGYLTFNSSTGELRNHSFMNGATPKFMTGTYRYVVW